MKSQSFLIPLLLLILLFRTTEADEDSSGRSTIIFTTNGRSSYGFDVYTLPLTDHTPYNPKQKELRLTDGSSVNFNGHFPTSSSSSSILSLLPNQNQPFSATSSPPPIHLIYVTERNGSSKINLDSLYYDGLTDSTHKRSVLEALPTESTRSQVTLVGNELTNGQVSMKDKPTLVGEYLIYVSTHENTGMPRTSWAAVYSTHLISRSTRRLTPYGVADFSPAVSPSGTWTAVASYGEKGWGGEIEELGTDIYVFLTQDGSSRVKVVEHGGWPSWADESTLYFHRRGDDGWWSIYRAILPVNVSGVDSVVTQRVTPPGLHTFTPAASVANKSFIALATRRPGSQYRHIELFDVVSNEFREVTQNLLPNAHHLNPFISSDSTWIGYHRCRGASKGDNSHDLFLENIQNPESEFSLFRFDGSFPSFSPDGDRIAYVQLPGLYVVNSNGSSLREVFPGMAFSTAWDQKRKGIIYTSIGPVFASESTNVDVVAIDVNDHKKISYKKLTTNGENNAFPSPSPDGKWIVFRSGRSGHKNLYIMDAVKGEAGGLYRLTEGPWSDTMCIWSPDGDWIVFASDRHSPDSGSFALYMIHPNGTGLRKLLQSGSAGRTNHPCFSPDGKSIVFTSDYAGVSAEPISNPHHYQPYGEIFTIRSDGSGLRRLTHNSFEDGTPAWGPKFLKPIDVQWPYISQCSFEDCHWLNSGPTNTSVNGTGTYSRSTKIECGQ